MGLGADLLQGLDLFKYPVSLRTRRSVRHRAGQNMFYGSTFGMILSFVILCLMTSYFVYLAWEMLALNKDRYSSQGLVNEFKDGQNFFRMADTNFLPVLDMTLMGGKNDFRALHKSDDDVDLFNQTDMDNDEWFKTFDIRNMNESKLMTYMKPQLKVKFRYSGEAYYVKTYFRRCTPDDFLQRGILPGDDKVLKVFTKRFCPDINDDFKKFWQVKNGYTNETERISFSVEIVKCNDADCKSEAQTQKIMNLMYFTVYTLEEAIDFKNPEKLNSRPVRVQTTFHSQFQLNANNYRDNNNFLRYNEVKTQDERVMISQTPQEYQFFDVLINPVWVSQGRLIRPQNVSTNGVDYTEVTDELYFGAYFFISTTMIEHTRLVSNVVGLLSEFGGLLFLLTTIFASVGFAFNYRLHTATMIHQMYFLKLAGKKDPKKDMWTNMKNVTPNLHQITFSVMDLFTDLKSCCCKYVCCKHGKDKQNQYLNRTEKIYMKGFHAMQKEMDITNMLTTIHKLKAGLSAVINEDEKLVERTKHYFYSNSTIFSDTEEETEMKKQNKFLEFLDQDELKITCGCCDKGDHKDKQKEIDQAVVQDRTPNEKDMLRPAVDTNFVSPEQTGDNVEKKQDPIVAETGDILQQ